MCMYIFVYMPYVRVYLTLCLRGRHTFLTYIYECMLFQNESKREQNSKKKIERLKR